MRITSTATRLEQEIDEMNADLNRLPLSFYQVALEVSAWLHLGRTVARRAERRMTELAIEEPVNEPPQYINRLSDHLFVLAQMNENGTADAVGARR